jgi:uncharacterized protein (DUF934 family)
MIFIDRDATLPAGALVLDNSEDVSVHAEALRAAPVVVLHFPRWTDGRAYSQAVVLRGRLRYAGEIRATGEVVVDMLPLLRRCGFDAVQLAAGQRRETAERALGHFDAHYQGDARQPLPHGDPAGRRAP